MPTASTTRVELVLELVHPRGVDARLHDELDAELLEQPRLVGQRLVRLPVGRDGVADEAADLLALVEHGHGVPPGGELARGGETGGASAHDRDTAAVGRRRLAQRDTVGVRKLRRIALEGADLDRRPAVVDEDAVALAEHLDRADAGTRPAEDVVAEDRPCRRAGVSLGDLRNEPRHVDAGGARRPRRAQAHEARRTRGSDRLPRAPPPARAEGGARRKRQQQRSCD